MATEGLKDQVCELAADIFGVDPSDLGPETSSETLESWDSIQRIDLDLQRLRALELEFGVALEPEEIEAMTNIAAIVEIITAAREA